MPMPSDDRDALECNDPLSAACRFVVVQILQRESGGRYKGEAHTSKIALVAVDTAGSLCLFAVVSIHMLLVLAAQIVGHHYGQHAARNTQIAGSTLCGVDRWKCVLLFNERGAGVWMSVCVCVRRRWNEHACAGGIIL